MRVVNSYQNTKYELELIKNRLNLILEYEQTLSKEKEQLIDLAELQEKIIQKMEKDLICLSGIENKLYCEIVLNGTNVTKAIDKIAFDEELDISTLWKNYYPKVKQKIKELELINIDDFLNKKR